MNNSKYPTRLPVLYLPHGGGPLPLLGDPSHVLLTRFLEEIGSRLGEPKTIFVVSAHWEEELPTVTSGLRPGLIYDYSGFPEESYQIQYPAPGSPELSERVARLLADAGIKYQQKSQRGFDHGLFVPLKLMFPNAEIPCIQLSLMSHLRAQPHIMLGKALSKLREEGVLIVGSGLSFHNMKAFFSAPNPEASIEFDQWLVETCCDMKLSIDQREQRLIDWENAPQARYCHPREEHLLPLQVCFGASQQHSSAAEIVFHQELMGAKVLGLLWD